MIQNSPEWIEWRKGGVGASEMPSILGVCPYGGTPFKVWQVKTGRSKGFEGNSFTEHGHDTEAAARARYELINMEDMHPSCATHPEFTICRASLDGFSADRKVILELKCPKGRDTIDSALAGKVPDHYWPQVQYQLAVTGADLCHFYVYHEESGEDALVEVKPDLEYQGKLIAAALEFWEKYVLTDTPPPLTSNDIKIVRGNPVVEQICRQIILNEIDKFSKDRLKKLMAEAVERGGHPKIRCGRVQIATVNRNGKFSYHKLTIHDEVSA